MELTPDGLLRAYLDAIATHRRALAALRDMPSGTSDHREAALRVQQYWLDVQAWQTAVYGVLSVPPVRER